MTRSTELEAVVSEEVATDKLQGEGAYLEGSMDAWG